MVQAMGPILTLLSLGANILAVDLNGKTVKARVPSLPSNITRDCPSLPSNIPRCAAPAPVAASPAANQRSE